MALVQAHPGMEAMELDISDPNSIENAASLIAHKHPSLNVLINNAGIMLADDAANPMDDVTAVSQITTNLLGPIRLTSALVPLLRRQPRAHIVYNTSSLGYTPLAAFAIYSATKAALHSYVLSQRFLLKDSRVSVQEIVPPWVGTGLFGPSNHPLAMDLDKFIGDLMALLSTDDPEIVVNEAKTQRENVGPNEHSYVDKINTFFLGQSY